LDARAKLSPEGIPTHCQRSGCDEPIAEQPATGRKRKYCSDACRIAANQQSRGRVVGRVVGPTQGLQRPAYGVDVLSVHREYRASLEGLRELAEQLSRSLVEAGDIRTAQASVQQAGKTFGERERLLIEEVNAEIQARMAATEDAESAREEASAATKQAELARAAQAAAEQQAERARRECSEALDRMQREAAAGVAVAEARATQAEAKAAEAQAFAARAEGARELLERCHTEDIEHLQQQATEARSAFEARARVLQQVADERGEQLRHAQSELALREQQARVEREALLVRVKSAEEAVVERGDLLQRLRAELDQARAQSEQQRAELERRIEQEALRGDARVRETREDLTSRLKTLEEIASERAEALQRYRVQLEQFTRGRVTAEQQAEQDKER
jgi:hypothetical protein